LFKLIAISIGFVTNRHTLLAPALQMARQTEFDSSCSVEFIHLSNRFESIIPSSTY